MTPRTAKAFRTQERHGLSYEEARGESGQVLKAHDENDEEDAMISMEGSPACRKRPPRRLKTKDLTWPTTQEASNAIEMANVRLRPAVD